MRFCYNLLFCLLFAACGSDAQVEAPPADSNLYFPPLNSEVWETIQPEELGWNNSEIPNLFNYLEQNNTRAFIILKDGKIVIEKYFGNNITNTDPFDMNSFWYWASAGKTLTAVLAGIAQEEGYINISDSTSDYLGEGWTNMPVEKESLITIRHQLTMTTGLDYEVNDIHCTSPDCLNYKTDAGEQWFYHNAAYTLIQKVISNATGMDYNEYTDEKIASKIGMNGRWIQSGFNSTYWSTAREMARYGLLMLRQGTWENTTVLSDVNYYNQMIQSSQNLNPSYGYLWWLNGKSSIILPSLPNSFNMPLSDAAPSDLYAGMGKNGQYVEIVPSLNLIVVRMGEAPGNDLVPILFHNEMWEKINLVLN